MLSVFRLIGVRHFLAKPLRTLLTVVAVALGVGLSVSISIINRSVLSSFRETVAALAGSAVLIISAGDVGFAEERVDDIAKVAGVKSAIPRVEAWGYAVGDRSASETLYILGIDLLREQSIRAYRTSGPEVMDDPLVFLNQPDSVILTKAFAASHGLAIGSRLPLATASGQIALTVRGLLEPEGPAKAYGGAIAIMDIDGARVMLGKEGKVDAVDIVPRSGVATDALQASLRAALGPSFVVAPPEGYAQQLEQLVKSFQGMLAFFGTIALIVGLFLVGNSVSMSIAERQREIGVLRSIGAERWQIFALLLGECAALGAAGSLVGAYLGRGLASAMVKDVAESMTDQFSMKVSVHELQFDRSVVLRAVVLGVTTAVLAGLLPIVRATRIAPTAAMRAGPEGDSGSPRGSRVRFALGLACVASVLATLVPALAASSALQGFAQAAGVVGVVGVALLSPSLVHVVINALGRLFRRGRDIVPRLAAENVTRHRRRTQSNVIGLTLGLLLVMMISGISHSFKETVQDWFTVSLRQDLLVCSTGKLLQGMSQPIHEELADDLAKAPGIWKRTRTVDGVRFVHVEYQGRTIALKAYDEADPSLHYWLFDMQDRTRDEAGAALYHSADPTVLVSTNFVLHFGKKTGDSITLDTPSGPTSFRIVGVMTEFASPEGVIYMSRDRYKVLWRDPLVTAFGLYIEPGADKAAVRSALDARFGREKNLMFILNDELRAEFTSTIDKSFAFTDALEWAALLVALLGIFNTLTIGILERTRELGMLRALGMGRWQLARMIFLEAALQGAATALLAVSMGTVLGYWMITRNLPTTLGWVLRYDLPWKTVAGIFVTGVAVATVAGAFPAWRASRMRVVDALGYD